MAMYENTKARDATVKKEDAKKGSAKNSVRSFCRSLLRGKPGVFRKEDEPLPQRQPVSK